MLNKIGLLSNSDLALKSLPPQDRQRVEQLIAQGQTIEVGSDPEKLTKIDHEVSQIIDRHFKMIADFQSRVSNGYQQAGSELRRLYPAPFAPYAFIGDNYWAAWKSRRELRVETMRDGYVIMAPERYSKKQIKLVEQVLKELKLSEFRVNAADHLNVFGNCWINKSNNGFNGVTGLNFLLPEKITPRLDVIGETIVAWRYYYGGRNYDIPLSDVDHLKTTSLRSLQLGTPSLQPLLVDIEASMFASIFNNTAFQKGGLIKAIISIEPPPTNFDSVVNPNIVFDFVKKLQEMYQRQFSGVRGALQLMFSPMVKDVHNLISPKDLEGIYKETNDRTAMKAAVVLGCTPERIGIPRQSQYQNNALVDDSVSLSFDNNQYYLVGIVDDYINNVLIPRLFGTNEIYIQASGEYGSISTSAAEFGAAIAQLGAKVITVDEFRVKVLHWEPLGGELGGKFLGDLAFVEAEKAVGGPAASKYFGIANPDLMVRGGVKIVKHHPRDIKFY